MYGVRGRITTSKFSALSVMVFAATVAFPTSVSAQQKIYWNNDVRFSQSIQRSNSDGSGLETVIEGKNFNNSILNMAIDSVGAKIYWADTGLQSIRRADRDGSNVKTLVTGVQAPRSIALDLTNGKIYWTDLSFRQIERSNLDGSGREIVLGGLNRPWGLALDVDGGKV